MNEGNEQAKPVESGNADGPIIAVPVPALPPAAPTSPVGLDLHSILGVFGRIAVGARALALDAEGLATGSTLVKAGLVAGGFFAVAMAIFAGLLPHFVVGDWTRFWGVLACAAAATGLHVAASLIGSLTSAVKAMLTWE